MALELVNPGINPIGIFDGADGIYLTVKGGEVASITGTSKTRGADLASADSMNDGYVGANRPVATTALVSGMRPLYLVDDGTAGYGTLFGSVVGGVAGQVTSSTNLGPHTAAASGKLTLWGQPGLFAVTLDAVDTTVATGLVPTNTTLQIGDALYATATGLLTPAVGSAFENFKLGRFLNFESKAGGALVTTPVTLVVAANSPSGIAYAQTNGIARALFWFNPNNQ